MKSKKKRFQQEDDQAFFEERDEGETDFSIFWQD